MKKLSLFLILLSLGFMSCEDFLNPQQALVVDESGLPNDERELLAMGLGLYAIQQDLVDQIVMLGELRGDLLTVTETADPDLQDINNFTIDKTNRYASPANFYKLIAACNKMIRVLEAKFPELSDEKSQISDIHRMYGEAVTMRSWAYFYAVRIYNEVPYIPETLTSIDEIVSYVNSAGTYIDSSFIDYSPFGYDNDSLGTDTSFIYTDRNFLDQEFMTRRCLKDLNKVRAVGVNYSIKDNINDDTWQVTVWNDNAFLAFKVQMYMHINAFDDANDILNIKDRLINLNYASTRDNYIQYSLDYQFSGSRWASIFKDLNSGEHLFVLDFDKSASSWQQNSLQYYMSVIPPNVYSIKPTTKSVNLWECVWKNYAIEYNDNPARTQLKVVNGIIKRGTPADRYRGRGISFEYMRNGEPITDEEYAEMLKVRTLGYLDEVQEIMRGVDTVAYKYTLGKTNFSKDADFILYRAAALHLYAAEIYANDRGINNLNKADQYIYTGDLLGTGKNLAAKLGVAGRVGLKTSSEGISLDRDYAYKFDPYTNDIIGYQPILGLNAKVNYFDDVLMDNRARELAYEGERFFDYVRIARRRNKTGNNGTEWLADRISATFPSAERATIKARLLDESNWYLPFVLK